MVDYLPLVLTGLGLTASIIYYAMVLRNANKTQQMQLETRQTQLFLELHGTDTEEQINQIITLIQTWNWDSMDDYYSKYGDRDSYSKRSACLQIYNG